MARARQAGYEACGLDHIYRRGKYWYVSIIIDGQRIRRSCGTDKQAALLARSELQKRRTLVAMEHMEIIEFHDAISRKGRRLVKEVVAEWLRIKSTTNRRNPMVGYHHTFKNHVLPTFGDWRVSQVTELDLVAFRHHLRHKLSERTTNKVLTLLGAVLKLAHRRKDVRENPMLYVEKCKAPRRPNKLLSFDELQKVLDLIPPEWKPVITFMAYTGCRHNEVFAVRWQDLDFTRGQIDINKGRVRGFEGPPKTSSSVRIVPMLPPVKALLLALRESQKTKSEERHVFLSPKNRKPFNDPKAFNEVWKRALVAAGFPPTRSYLLRHTFASNMLENGVPALYVSSILGHADLSTTFRSYAEAIASTQDRNRQMMADIVTRRVGF